MADKESGRACKIVIKLMKLYKNKGHALYLDNFYTSIPLEEDLLRQGIQIAGTIHSNHRGAPKIIQVMRLQRGETILIRERDTLFQKWRDKRDIHMISTRHDGTFAETLSQFD